MGVPIGVLIVLADDDPFAGYLYRRMNKGESDGVVAVGRLIDLDLDFHDAAVSGQRQGLAVVAHALVLRRHEIQGIGGSR